MVKCEYCMHEVPKGEKRKNKFFLVLEAGTKIPLDQVEEYVKKHHHQIKVCRKCHDDIFKDNHSHSLHKKSPSRDSPSQKKKSSPRKKKSSPRKKKSSQKKRA